MQNHSIEITKTARYWTYGQLNQKTKNVWFVAHGYGQLAEYFIKKFAVLDPESNFVIAPEALSRFYLKAFTGNVGATWMTKEDRLNEIKDYVNYLNQLYLQIFSQSEVKPETVKIYALGFSQGTNTICRWVYNQQVKIDRLIVWAGNFPPDVDTTLTPKILGETPIFFVFGEEDELINPQIFEHEQNQLKIKKVKFESFTFNGKHDLDSATLLKLSEL